MKELLFVSSGPPVVLRAPDVVSAWFISRELIYRELEIGTVNMLARAYDKVYLLTYDDQEDAKKYENRLAENVQVLFKPKNLPDLAHKLVAPLIFRRYFEKACVCRTNQLKGSPTALIAKFFFGTKLLLRQGYQVSKQVKVVLSSSPRPFRAHVFYVLTVLLEFIAYHAADMIIVSCDADKDYVIRRYRVDARKIFVVPNWVDVSLFKPLPNIQREKGRVVFVGKLDLIKNTFSLVDAVRDLSAVRLYLIGDGPLRKALGEKLRDERIDNVVLLGTVPRRRLPVELNRSEVFILPSLYEGNPKALLEAMACGLPAIGTNVTGIRDLIKHGVTGFLCDANSDSIRAAIKYLISKADLRGRLGRNARAEIENNYSLDRVLEKEVTLRSLILKETYSPTGTKIPRHS